MKRKNFLVTFTVTRRGDSYSVPPFFSKLVKFVENRSDGFVHGVDDEILLYIFEPSVYGVGIKNLKVKVGGRTVFRIVMEYETDILRFKNENELLICRKDEYTIRVFIHPNTSKASYLIQQFLEQYGGNVGNVQEIDNCIWFRKRRGV